VFIKSITFDTSSDVTGPAQTSFPSMANDPFLSAAPSVDSALAAESSTALVTPKPFAPPTPALKEMPTCPVCLERMDESTGLLIILCQHVFHCGCLEKWKGSGCPVCRYTQSGYSPGRIDNNITPNQCSACDKTTNLWICLICGNVGCGRYNAAHAYAHWEATGHSFAMDIEHQHVWDYAGDGFVHRLIQNKGDGKLMELPKAASGTSGSYEAYGADMVPREKMEAMGNEYTYLLTSQLESQRRYFEEQLLKATAKADSAKSAEDHAVSSIHTVREEIMHMKAKMNECLVLLNENSKTIEGLSKDLDKQKRKTEKAEDIARKMAINYQDQKSMNDGMSKKISHLEEQSKKWHEERNKFKDQIADLEDQNRDLTIFISSQDKIKELEAQGEEVVDGRVEVPVKKEESSKGGKKKRR
jgi:BRCA1-associated protein